MSILKNVYCNSSAKKRNELWNKFAEEWSKNCKTSLPESLFSLSIKMGWSLWNASCSGQKALEYRFLPPFCSHLLLRKKASRLSKRVTITEWWRHCMRASHCFIVRIDMMIELWPEQYEEPHFCQDVLNSHDHEFATQCIAHISIPIVGLLSRHQPIEIFSSSFVWIHLVNKLSNTKVIVLNCGSFLSYSEKLQQRKENYLKEKCSEKLEQLCALPSSY